MLACGAVLGAAAANKGRSGPADQMSPLSSYTKNNRFNISIYQYPLLRAFAIQSMPRANRGRYSRQQLLLLLSVLLLL